MPPHGESALGLADAERPREAERPRADDHSTEIPRRVLAKDGLHVAKERAREGRASEPPPPEDRSLMALVSSARHELRAPLQSIQGFAELLASEAYGQLGADQRVFIEHIIQGSSDLSRALDACFELVSTEVLHLPPEPLRAPLRPLLEESMVAARAAGQLSFDVQLATLSDAVEVEVDLHDFTKAVGAIVTALAPLVRGSLTVSVVPLDERVEIFFAAAPGDGRGFRLLHELPRRGLSARALLWLRLAGSLLGRTGARLETNEGYDRVRVSMPRIDRSPRLGA